MVMKKEETLVSILSAKRLPIGKIRGIYGAQKPEDLFQALVTGQLQQLENFSAAQIEQVILGNVTNLGGNLARRCALAAGISPLIPAVTVDCQCASGLVALAQGAQQIISGAAKAVLAGGVESTSTALTVLDPQTKQPLKRYPMVPAGYPDLEMGVVADLMSKKYHVSRLQQDEYAYHSQQKARVAFEQKLIQAEIVPFQTEIKTLWQDESPRFETSLAKLSQLQPVFTEEGTATAGNSCPINDGAATVILEKYQQGKQVQGYLLDQVIVGLNPVEFLRGPIIATEKLLAKHQLQIADLDVVELNEAFAVQSILCQKELGIEAEQLNPLGGALAYGHPYGATGAILMARLLNSLNRKSGPALGLVTLCVAGGMGMSMLIGNQFWEGEFN
ncbi:acetyl-CoA acetyltransferase [Liquorilactobacillus satsumensis DSM 16230 = JCM 12392]|uniref:acetyl-CoA C-acyltransferase n=2 Tax=Liquorilactobacillus satsumensis TaxID=259059 RepID=A0A0R1UV54_9LACO|nr:acetyl-CoA acetyltransferase [Liquorilactobacillus satsumensis DSM 16230 = JCM 12392]